MVSEKFLEIAKEELREDESRKTQALQHFREWIAKHPFIRSIRQDDVFLLQFLRTKKYSMDRAFHTFENYIRAQKKYSKWFDFKEEDFDKMMELYKTGYIYPLTERDENGRRIVFSQMKKLDPERFTSADAIRLSSVISSALLEEEETQIAGISTIIDYDGVTMKQISLFSVTDIVDFANCSSNAVGRYKQLILVNLPSFAVFLLDVAKSTLKEKLRQRIILAKDMKDVANYVDPQILTKEHGGLISEQEQMENFSEFFRSVRPKLEEIKARVIDWSKVPDINSMTKETIGSFRKLDID